MHTKCSRCDVAYQKIFQETENIRDTSDMTRWQMKKSSRKKENALGTTQEEEEEEEEEREKNKF